MLSFATDPDMSLPAVSKDMAAWYQKHLEAFYNEDELRAVSSGNVLKFMPHLQKRIDAAKQ